MKAAENELFSLKCGDGTEFFIDPEDFEKVKSYSWHINKDGYPQASVRKLSPLLLHRYVLGVSDPSLIVDHINRRRWDCRKSNLRIVTAKENSCNHGKFVTNKTGFTGVYYSTHAGRYEVKIGWDKKRIKLGSSSDNLVELAQMYNVAAKYLYGEYTGALNDVPEPSAELTAFVIDKCRLYLAA